MQKIEDKKTKDNAKIGKRKTMEKLENERQAKNRKTKDKVKIGKRKTSQKLENKGQSKIGKWKTKGKWNNERQSKSKIYKLNAAYRTTYLIPIL